MKTTATQITMTTSAGEFARAEALLSAAGMTFTEVEQCADVACSVCTRAAWNPLHEAA